MSYLANYCLEPDYTKAASGWADSSTNDQWLIKNRGNSVTVAGVSLYTSYLHVNRDEPHSAFCPFIPAGVSASVNNGRGDSRYFQCKEI